MIERTTDIADTHTLIDLVDMASLPVFAVDVDYDEQLDRIKDFLHNGKAVTTQSRLADDGDDDDEAAAEEDAALDIMLGGVDIDVDAIDGGRRRKTTRSGYKYRDALQRIANRQQDKIIIDLEDIANYPDGHKLVTNINEVSTAETADIHWIDTFHPMMSPERTPIHRPLFESRRCFTP